MFLKKIQLFFILLLSIMGHTQNAYVPADTFINPLDIPLVLSGTFGELRSNHFHSGIDLKTQQKEGLNVYSIADGYVSRIKISFWGYGKAIYITHPNGYTSVYGHLSKLSPELEKYVKKAQYAKQKYQVELFPTASEFPVIQGDVVAYSGNTGGSGGPHLHFEIRETNNQTPMNPMLFGINVADTRFPEIKSLYAYPLSENAQVNRSEKPIQINFSSNGNASYIADTVYASGEFGFALNTFDKQNGANNHNGVYSIEMKVDGQRYFYHDVEKFSFSETKYINKLIDYKHYKENRSRLQKCFIEPGNKLGTYDRSSPYLGYLQLNEGEKKNVEIIVCDFKQNETKIAITVVGKKMGPTITNSSISTNYYVDYKKDTSFDLDSLYINFPKYSFYNNHYIDITPIDKETVIVHEDILPLRKRFSIRYDLSHLDPKTQKHSYVALQNDRGDFTRISSKRKGNHLYGYPKRLGIYRVLQDYKSPEIAPVNFTPEQWLSSKEQLTLKIEDNLSGIDSYKGYINGTWVLFEWDYKTGLITYDFSDKTFPDKKHDLEIIVTDHAQNTKVYKTTFYRVYE